MCATAWYDKQLMAAIFTTGKGSSTDVTTAWIKEDLDDVVEDLEGADPDKVEVTATRASPSTRARRRRQPRPS